MRTEMIQEVTERTQVERELNLLLEATLRMEHELAMLSESEEE